MAGLFYLVQKNSPNVRNSNLISNRFEKSHVIDSLVGNEGMKIDKTGKEIKSQIISVKSTLEAKKNIHYQNMLMYKKQAGIEPTGYFDEYDTRGLQDRVGEVKRYGYDQKYQKKEEDNLYNQNSSVVTEQQKEAMDKYNDCAREYIERSVDIIVLDTLAKNLSDNKKISLNPKQAALLGF